MRTEDGLTHFLNHLHRGGEWAYWWTSEEKQSIWWPVGKPLPCPNGRHNVYFGVHPTSKPKRSRERSKKADVAAVNCLFADLDAKAFGDSKAAALAHLESLDPAPSVAVDSGGGYHAYWLFDRPFTLNTKEDRERAARLQAGWVALVGGDPGAKDLARVLRVPGTTNYKADYGPDFPQVCFIRVDLDRVYSLGDLEALIPNPGPPKQKRQTIYVGNFTDDVSKAARALERLNPTRCNDYHTWVDVGMTLSELGNAGLGLWQNWSRGSAKHNPGECEEKWKTFTPGNGLTLGSLFHWADEDDPPLPKSKPVPVTEPPEAEPGPIEGDASAQFNTWPYEVNGGRLVYLVKKVDKDGETEIERKRIADFTAQIVEEITNEDGDRLYRLAGRAIRGGEFETEITAEDFSEDRRLKAALDAAAGAQDPVRAGMTKHLGPAIKLLTGNSLTRTLRYNRTGWAEGCFLVPGREPAGVQIHLPRKLPYATNPDADLDRGLGALEALLQAMGPERGAPILAFTFQGPMARLAGWRNERYCLFISGRTGALKTSYAQACLALYGASFIDDSLLIKWGEGATRNAIMAMATHAHDLPLLIDNFKPSTGGGTKDFVNLIHNILEGGEKDRLNRAAQLRETRPVFCWPLVTGEDVPDRDPATLARILVVPFAWQRGEANEPLTRAQRLSPHLAAVGATWLDWLESDAGAAAAREAGSQFADTRDVWAGTLRTAHPDMVNILRVASNLASNLLTWDVLCQHPTIGPMAERYRGDHHAGLERISMTMGEHTTEALEGIRYLEGLRQLLASGGAYLLPSTFDPMPEVPTDRERFIGWSNSDDGAYLIPDVARGKIERLVGKDALGFLSNTALYAQLDALGAIANHDKGKSLKTIWVDGKARKVLYLTPAALCDEEEKG